MGEAVITRQTKIPEEVLNPIYPVEGRHVIVATVKTDLGTIMQNYPVSCEDGSNSYTYKTNESGQVKFSCASGAANIFINNIVDGKQYVDFKSAWKNIDAPVGGTSRVNIAISRQTEFTEFLSNSNFTVIEDRAISSIIIVGGGGGGSSGITYDYSGDSDYWWWAGAGGGGGYFNWYNNPSVQLIRNNIYQFQTGIGGAAGGMDTNGSTGGTSVIKNMNMSAIGGGGGTCYAGSRWTNYSIGGTGGTGNGGYGGKVSRPYSDTIPGNNGEPSPLAFAGGGGGAGGYGYNPGGGYGGTPYGGTGGIYSPRTSDPKRNSTSGTRGGGGGGGFCWGNTSADYARLASGGGNGLMRITLKF